MDKIRNSHMNTVTIKTRYHPITWLNNLPHPPPAPTHPQPVPTGSHPPAPTGSHPPAPTGFHPPTPTGSRPPTPTGFHLHSYKITSLMCYSSLIT